MKEYEKFIRSRITELRLIKRVSEHRMSLDIGKSGAYIRSITSGTALPSLRELFNITSYFGLTPSEFFAPFENQSSTYYKICCQLQRYNEEDLNRILMILDLIK